MAIVTTMDWKTKGILLFIKWTFLTISTFGVYPVYRIIKHFKNKNTELNND